jgi:2-hydroxychromene-2-carboxylate isomerase
VTWRTFLLGAVFKVTGMDAISQMPLRGDYARRDWARLARLMQVRFVPPPGAPPAALAASRAFYWIERRDGPDRAAIFAGRVFEAQFAEGGDIVDAGSVAALAAQVGVDPDALLKALAEPPIKEKLRSVTAEAVKRGIFGSPFFIADGEPFWGHDRLSMVDEWLARQGW